MSDGKLGDGAEGMGAAEGAGAASARCNGARWAAKARYLEAQGSRPSARLASGRGGEACTL